MEPLDALGRPLRDLRLSVTDRCNFRCPYCMPAELFGERYAFLPRPEILSFEEIERLVRLFVELGVRKLRITGGEPLIRAELPRLIERLARIDGIEDLALTSNGFLLARHAVALADAGLSRVTVSLDALDPEVFKTMSGSPHEPERVLEGIAAAADAGLGPLKINCVVQQGVNEDEVLRLAEHFRGTPHIVRFIEFMDVGTRNRWDLDRVVRAGDIVERIGQRYPLEPLDANYPGEVARRYRYADGQGEVGVIASVTQPFCRGCTRARVTAEGRLVTCLFSDAGVDLKGPLRDGRSDEAVRDIVRGVWSTRSDRYSEERAGVGGPVRSGRRIEMYQVGG